MINCENIVGQVDWLIQPFSLLGIIYAIIDHVNSKDSPLVTSSIYIYIYTYLYLSIYLSIYIYIYI